MTTEPTSPRPTPPPVQGGILPGMAAVMMFMLFVSMYTAFGVARDASMARGVRYTILGICTLVVIGVFGMIRLRRWGWALVTGGCIIGSLANVMAFRATHIGGYLVQGLFSLVFFLYLVRTEVRDRLRSPLKP